MVNSAAHHHHSTAALALPPVERVRPGVWSIPVPLPTLSLRYVLVYALEARDGVYLVDAGWSADESFDALCAGLALAGASITDVRGVLVTHMHSDHFGLSGRIQRASGAWVGLHPADADLARTVRTDTDGMLEDVDRRLIDWGVPTCERAELRLTHDELAAEAHESVADVLVEDGDKVNVPGWDVRAVWTPGHSPGHLCFHEPTSGTLWSGDHVLPRITPNVGAHVGTGADPLGAFLASLSRVERLVVRTVLPAHEHRFEDLGARVAELRAHHVARFDEVRLALSDGPATTWQVANRMTWSRTWPTIRGANRRGALAEAAAHAMALEVIGEVTVVERAAGAVRWVLRRSGPSTEL